MFVTDPGPVKQDIHQPPEQVTNKEAANSPRFDHWPVFNDEMSLSELLQSAI